MRHGLDGDFGHFLGDAATYNYAQSHNACDHTNLGFAFNEGWAEFWAGRSGAPTAAGPATSRPRATSPRRSRHLWRTAPAASEN